jgi:hypothetical protein
MSELVKVKALVEHENSYGPTYEKKTGDEYEVDAVAAAILAANGVCELASAAVLKTAKIKNTPDL